MRIGYVQFAPTLGDPSGNLREAAERVRQAPPADLLVLPELCNSGYNFLSIDQARGLAESASPKSGSFVRGLVELAEERQVNLVAGICEREGDTLYNSAVLARTDGSTELYRKLHLFWNEKSFFSPGNLGLPVFSVGEAKVGILICFDWQFPETWRTLALAGAEIVCHPSNLVLPGMAQKCIPVHALLNRIHVVTANRTGTEGDLNFTGRSIVVGTRGEVLSEATATGGETGVVEIDVSAARDKSVTPRNDLFGDRRPEFYTGWGDA